VSAGLSPKAPIIVAVSDLLNQTAAVGQYTVYTAAEDSLFRVSAAGVQRSDGTGGSGSADIKWQTPYSAALTATTTWDGSSPNSVDSVDKVIFVGNGKDVTVTITLSGPYNGHYDFHLVLERL
jgi:hypothetical protein